MLCSIFYMCGYKLSVVNVLVIRCIVDLDIPVAVAVAVLSSTHSLSFDFPVFISS